MKKEDAIKKAVQFLLNLPHIDLGDEESIKDYCDFDNSNKPYYVYVDIERSGCFESNTGFFSKTEVNSLIKEQLDNEDGKWDHILILDVKNNKRVYPKI